MKRHWFIVAVLVFVSSSYSYADDFSNNFQANLNQTAIDKLTQDVGAVAAAGSFHQGKALGSPVGFDIGFHVPYVGVQDEDTILRDDGSTVSGNYGQLEVGLPANFNLIGRYGDVNDANLIGGGLRWGVFTPSQEIGFPALSISGLYNELDHDFFKSETLSVNAVVSIGLKFIHPYIGVGYDHTNLDLSNRAFAGVPASVSSDLGSSMDGYRLEAGINLSLIQFTYITLGAGLANSEKMYHGGLGIVFP